MLPPAIITFATFWPLIPFILLLIMIATGPIFFPHWWHKNYPIISVVGAVFVSSIYLFGKGDTHHVIHALYEYIGFIAMVASLYIVAGGIHIGVKGEATPLVNCIILAIGAVLANIIGTTGASMLMIRPWIRLNKYRITAHHIVFFIFIVSNVGGCLTPIGDPPLFLGFLKGVPFWWTLQNLWKQWLVVVIALIAVFYMIDRRNFHKTPKPLQEFADLPEKWSFSGVHNILFLILVLIAVFLPPGWREGGLAAAALCSWFLTSRHIHKSNGFSFGPLKEVAWLFLGIFVTMIPALEFLQLHGKAISPSSAMGYYWATGLLSGILDNAPTYLAFLATAFGTNGLLLDNPAHMTQFIKEHSTILTGISLGAVFFGAMSYIGNGPNFMVKAISEHMGVKTPTFFGYVFRFALPILLPILALAGFFFFR